MKTIFGEKDRLLREAQLHLSKNHFQDAETLLLKYMENSPDHFGQLYLALAIHQQNRTDEALGILQDVIKQEPKEPEIFHYYRALFYFDVNKYDKCNSELKKIKKLNHFHSALRSLAEVLKDFTGNSKNYQSSFLLFKNNKAVSLDLQARVLFKLESYLPINLTKRAHANSLPSQWNPIVFAQRRILEKSLRVQELIKKAIYSAENSEFKNALDLMSACFELEINNLEVENARLKISELILAKQELAISQVDPHEIAWAFFYRQQFQKGLEFCSPYLMEKKSIASNSNYIEILDISGYLHFCLGNFSSAEKLLNDKIELDAKESEQPSYFYAACLQHSKKHFEAINAYKKFINNSLNGYTTQLNCAMKTIAPDLKI